MPPKLHLENISLRYGKRTLFTHITLVMEGGEAWAVTGPNGSGKSSFLSLLAGYSSPTEGKIMRQVPLRFIFWQSPHVQPPPELLVRDVVKDWQRQKATTLPQDFLLQWDLPPDKPLYLLSSGMRQRLLVALALYAREGLILLDEPTAFLDESYRLRVHELLRLRIGEPHLLIVCATNDSEEVKLFQKTLHLPAYAA